MKRVIYLVGCVLTPILALIFLFGGLNAANAAGHVREDQSPNPSASEDNSDIQDVLPANLLNGVDTQEDIQSDLLNRGSAEKAPLAERIKQETAIQKFKNLRFEDSAAQMAADRQHRPSHNYNPVRAEPAPSRQEPTPQAPLIPNGLFTITLQTVHRNANTWGSSSTFVFTNTGATSVDYYLDFYWPNDEFYGSDGPYSLAPGAALNYDMESASLPSIEYAGRVEIHGDEPLIGQITSPDYGLISGHVYEDNGATPIAGADIQVDSYPHSDYNYGNIVSLSDGAYYFGGLPDGSFYVHVSPGDEWAKQWYDGASDSQSATPVEIAGASTVIAIDFILQPGGYITGTVYAEDGITPLENINVDLEQGWFGTCTDANGNYTIRNIPYGEHKVNAGMGWNWCMDSPNTVAGEWYNETYDYYQATPLAVNGGSDIITDINFTLSEGGTITGQVTAAEDGSPIPNISVYVNEYDEGWYGTEIRSDSNGYYTVTGLIPGDYRVEAEDNDGLWPLYARQYFDQTFRHHLAERVPVLLGSETPDINFVLEPGGSIYGVVIDENTGAPIPNLNINAWSHGAGGGGACTNGSGEFSIEGLILQDYYVNAGGSWNHCIDQHGEYAREFYPNAYLESDGSAINLTAVMTEVFGIDFALDGGGYITGHVETSAGAPLNDFRVEAHLPNYQCPDCSEWYDDISTDQSGNFLLGPLPELSFGIYACADCDDLLLVNKFYNDAYAFGDADLINVISGTTITSINFVLDQGILISGVITVPLGYSPEGIRVEAWRNDSPNYYTDVNTDENGEYILAVPPIYDDMWTLQASPEETDLESRWARFIDISQSSFWDFDLQVGSAISGCITSGGAPVSGVWVDAWSQWMGTGDRTGPDGCYLIKNLPPAGYEIHVDGSPDYAYNTYDSGYPGW
ncbi:carboxypeptidase regulatory-like domain-containing protein, partial [Chloroflexota bacterium]